MVINLQPVFLLLLSLLVVAALFKGDPKMGIFDCWLRTFLLLPTDGIRQSGDTLFLLVAHF